MTIHIYDFDQTITKNHTFRSAQIRDNTKLDPGNLEELEKGINDSVNNVKLGFLKKLEMDKDKAYVIATHHNNPAFIAGYMQAILSTEVTTKVTYVNNKLSSDENIAIAEYQTTDGKSLLISYIPKVGEEFNQTRTSILHSKNEQLMMLQDKLTQQDEITKRVFMQPGELINFYDDDIKNVNFTSNLSGINIAAHQVDSYSDEFAIIGTPQITNTILSQPSNVIIEPETIEMNNTRIFETIKNSVIVHPKSLTRNLAEIRANETNQPIFRETDNLVGKLALTLPSSSLHRNLDDRNLDVGDLIIKAEQRFETAEEGIKYLEGLIKKSFDCDIKLTVLQKSENNLTTTYRHKIETMRESDQNNEAKTPLQTMKDCGLVYPSSKLDRAQAQHIANSNGKAIIRESNSQSGLLALTLPYRDPQSLTDIIRNNPNEFKTAETGIKYLEKRFNCTIDRSLMQQRDESETSTPEMSQPQLR